jgi:hypothetical protein
VRSLVVFYSRTGTTSLVASKIAALLEADTDRILSRTAYNGGWGFARGIFHSLTDRQVSIEDTKISPANYDLVAVGGPVWAGRIASPVRAYLRQHSSHLKNAAYFVTQGGPSPGRSLTQMETISGRRPIATLSISSTQHSNGSYDRAVRGFVDEIRSMLQSEELQVS